MQVPLVKRRQEKHCCFLLVFGKGLALARFQCRNLGKSIITMLQIE